MRLGATLWYTRPLISKTTLTINRAHQRPLSPATQRTTTRAPTIVDSWAAYNGHAQRRLGVTASAMFSGCVHCGEWCRRAANERLSHWIPLSWQSTDGSMATTSRHAGLMSKRTRHLGDRRPPRDGVIKPLWGNNLTKPNFSTKCMASVELSRFVTT